MILTSKIHTITMQNSTIAPPPARHAMPSGWQQLLDALAQRNVLPDARRWYTVRVRDFIEELLDKDLSQVTQEDV